MIKPGRDPDGVAQTEADHLGKCPGCGQRFDIQVLLHFHDAEIEIGEGPVPPPRRGES